MSSIVTLNRPLRSKEWLIQHNIIKEIGLILFGVCLLTAASQLVIPLQPVPLTFQSAAVVLLGMLYGARRASGMVLCYLAGGVLGLPLFSGWSGGWSLLAGPKAGYLMGFLPAVWLAGFLADRGLCDKIYTAFCSACLSVSVIFGMGLFVLAHFMGWHQAVAAGLMPFVVTEPLKLLAICCVVTGCRRKVG